MASLQTCWGCGGSGKQNSKTCKVCFHHTTGKIPRDGRVRCHGCGGTGKQNGRSCKVCFHHETGCLPPDVAQKFTKCWGCGGTGTQNGKSCRVCFHTPTGCLPMDDTHYAKCWGCGGTGTQRGKACSVCFFEKSGVLSKAFTRSFRPCPACNGTSKVGGKSCDMCFFHPAGCVPLTDIDGSRVFVPESEAKGRMSRLRRNQKTLYDQTDSRSAAAILSSQRMMRGSQGLAGGGIYFAETPQHTAHKAHKHGVILECQVLLGRSKTISPNGDGSITFAKLLQEGYDSVIIPRRNGTEFVVYNFDQVVSIRKA